DQRRVRNAIGDQPLLECTVALIALVPLLAVWVEPDAPTPPEDPVVPLDKSSEELPRLFRERLDRRRSRVHGRHADDATPNDVNEVERKWAGRLVLATLQQIVSWERL